MPPVSQHIQPSLVPTTSQLTAHIGHTPRSLPNSHYTPWPTAPVLQPGIRRTRSALHLQGSPAPAYVLHLIGSPATDTSALSSGRASPATDLAHSENQATSIPSTLVPP